ncbi:protein of unknown function [Lachnospiraceae bacterium RM5]|nr:protein of unknown function [Lachnospiraceae bacterium RM5]
MKKIISILMIISMVLLTSCHMSESVKLSNRKKKEGKEIAEKIVECINNKDAHGIEELFCEEFKKNTELEWNIMDVIEKVDFKIDTYEIDTDGSGKTSISDGEIVYDFSYIYIEKINGRKTDENQILIGVTWVNDENKELEGVNGLSIVFDGECYGVKID